MKLRPATLADAEAIWRAEQETSKTPGIFNSLPEELEFSAFQATIRERGPLGAYVVAEDETALLGHAVLLPMPLRQRSHICTLNINVHPGHRGGGVGTRLMEAVIEWAGANGIEKIELLVRHTNERAIGLYENFGFQVEGRFKKRLKLASGTYVDDIAMALFLT